MTVGPPDDGRPGGPGDPRRDEADDEHGAHEGGTLGPTDATALTVAAGVGIVAGWGLHPLGRAVWGTPPFVTWLQVLTLLALAAAVGGAAWTTRRTLHVRRERMEPHRAVNRFAMGRAAALVGALAAGGYAGYAISWLGVGAQLTGDRFWLSLAAAAAALLVLGAGLALERACRVPPDER